MYYGLTGSDVSKFSPKDLDAPFVEISDQSKKALKKALEPNLKTTPKSVRDFMHMLPGCEDMEFEDILPEDDEFNQIFEEGDPNDFGDLPYFT